MPEPTLASGLTHEAPLPFTGDLAVPQVPARRVASSTLKATESNRQTAGTLIV